jgi:hypothetical protein
MRSRRENEEDEYKLYLAPLGEDEGRFGVKVSALNTSTPKT